VLFAACAAVLAYFIARQWFSQLVALSVTLLASTSTWMLSGGVRARMDIVCVALILGAALGYIRFVQHGRLRSLALSSVLSGLAFITHPLGLIAIAAIGLHLLIGPQRSVRAALVALAPFVTCIAVWALYALADPHAFGEQIQLQLERKQGGRSYFQQFTLNGRHALVLALALGGTVIFAVRHRRDQAARFLVVLAITSFALATLGGEYPYFMYFIPPCCVAAGAWFGAFPGSRVVLPLAVAAAIISETGDYLRDVRSANTPADSVQRQLVPRIPPSTSVYIGPGAASVFFALRGRNDVSSWVPVPLQADRQARLAARSDFIAVSVPVAFVPELEPVIARRHRVATISDANRSFEVYSRR
jgi:hypothetical protein